MKSKIYQVEVFEDGSFQWKLKGRCHREDGPAVKYSDGTEFYYLNDKLHREDGPAVKYSDGTEFYFLNDKRHREDGPAIKRPDGTEEYWLNGNQYSKEAFDKEISNRQQKSIVCENKCVIIDGVKYKLTKV